MKSLKSNQIGASRIIVAMVVLVVVAAAGAGGWWLWQRNAPQEVDETPDTTQQTEQPATEEQTAAQTVEASPASGDFSVRILESWQQQDCAADNPNILFVAPTTDLLGKCASEFFGLIAVSKTEGDRREDESAYSGRTDINLVSYDQLMVDTMPAIRVEYTQSEEPIVGPPVGTRYIEVIAFDGTYSFSMSYTQQPGWDDYRAEFDAIVSSLAR